MDVPAAAARLSPKAMVKFIGGSADSWGREAAKAGGSFMAHGGMLVDTVRLAVKGGFSLGGLCGGAVGSVAPTSRDDWNGLAENNFIPSFNPVTTPIQIVGGFAGGAFD
ncbi:hypothetical protein Acy02nite_91030 [Actinoplanes cyaneus]|uniref:Uncharacterized protein n=1 Tax=Actinoplanes cyaneus TaxID=52696 RepID=A0A919IVG3_9ACTN|nr:hypothetical protein [Actinoplanes cyaneus]MCW2144548.1 hypothetical protein [Actinoplanes cyaneus]GID71222.1 hypothetical protein Acy02nite_91030 [Actinoplanes cyaneus]